MVYPDHRSHEEVTVLDYNHYGYRLSLCSCSKIKVIIHFKHSLTGLLSWISCPLVDSVQQAVDERFAFWIHFSSSCHKNPPELIFILTSIQEDIYSSFRVYTELITVSHLVFSTPPKLIYFVYPSSLNNENFFFPVQFMYRVVYNAF